MAAAKRAGYGCRTFFTIESIRYSTGSLRDRMAFCFNAFDRNENGLLTGYVYVDVAGRDLQSYLNEARAKTCPETSYYQGKWYFASCDMYHNGTDS